MLPKLGTDHFADRFDFYKWSAPFYKTPMDVVKRVLELGVEGKTLKSIRVIGKGDDPGKTRNGQLYRRLTDAGIDADWDWYETYPHLHKIQVPQSVLLYEPVQFIFTDGTSLEILPTEDGGARVGFCTIPQALTKGLNNANFSADIFFAELLGKKLESFSVTTEEKITRYADRFELENGRRYQETRSEYFFRFRFGDVWDFCLRQEWRNEFRMEREKTVDYGKVLEAVQPTDQAEIMSGRAAGGNFWIVPYASAGKDDGEEWLPGQYGISVEEDILHSYLSVFLYRYYDASVQDREQYEEDGFDWYGGNRYRFEAVRRMLADIRETACLLQEDFDDPRLEKIKKNFPWIEYAEKSLNEMTPEELNEVKRKGLKKAVDFYERFCLCMENMMTVPGCDTISFAGP